jgi:hypothetical protein
MDRNGIQRSSPFAHDTKNLKITRESASPQAPGLGQVGGSALYLCDRTGLIEVTRPAYSNLARACGVELVRGPDQF